MPQIAVPFGMSDAGTAEPGQRSPRGLFARNAEECGVIPNPSGEDERGRSDVDVLVVVDGGAQDAGRVGALFGCLCQDVSELWSAWVGQLLVGPGRGEGGVRDRMQGVRCGAVRGVLVASDQAGQSTCLGSGGGDGRGSRVLGAGSAREHWRGHRLRY